MLNFEFSASGRRRSVRRRRSNRRRLLFRPFSQIDMMRMKARTKGASNPQARNETSATHAAATSEWEVRPGGMLVQRRTSVGSDQGSVIRVRVKHGSTYHEIHISPQASFGELKKKLTAATGLHHQDQKLLFKDRERGSAAYLDVCGVKDRSKMVVMEDPISQEKRYLEMRRSSKMDKTAKSISEISLEIDRLASQVSGLETVASRGGGVAETEVVGLIELLMNQLLKLDGIAADGDVKLQRKMQVRRVQKQVEILDALKAKAAAAAAAGQDPASRHHRRRSDGAPKQNQSPPPGPSSSRGLSAEMNQLRLEPPSPVVVTTKWETFDSAAPSSSVHPKFNWEFFD